jgi:hypothetical protein
MSIRKKRTIITDPSTGEVYSDKSEYATNKLWKDGKGGMIMPRNGHKKIYGVVKLTDVVKDKGDRANILVLLDNIYKDTNKICAGRKIAGIPDIAAMLNLREERAKRFLWRMMKIGIIAKMTVEVAGTTSVSWVFNPVFVNSCRYVSPELYLTFQKYIDEVLPEWMRRKYAECLAERAATETEQR